MVNNEIFFKDIKYKNYGDIKDFKPNIYDQNRFSGLNNFKENFNLLITNISSTKFSIIHVLKQIFKNLSNALTLNILNPSVLLIYNFFEGSSNNIVSTKEFISENINFLKEIIFNITQKTIFNIIYSKLKDEIMTLITNNVIGDQKEKLNYYILQYRSLLNLT